MERVDLKYLRRCRQLARMGRFSVAPNPPVGSVLIYKNRIIGEGFHQALGEAHAEVNAIESVRDEDRDKISESTLYVSLEPCNHHGRTPPCTQLILRAGIPRVVIGSRDPFITENGGGLEYLRAKKVQVDFLDRYPTSELLDFKESVLKNRPRIILKCAVSKNGYIGKANGQAHLSNAFSQRWVHALRAQCQAIMVGTNTIVNDNPRLDNRKFYGTSPIVVVPDRKARLKGSENLFRGNSILYLSSEGAQLSPGIGKNKSVKLLRTADWSIPGLMELLWTEGISSLFVEGGRQLMEAFIHSNYWDEYYEIQTRAELSDGVAAPVFKARIRQNTWCIGNDEWIHYIPVKS